MAYHITSLVNNSGSVVALVNPQYPSDSFVLASGSTQTCSRPVLVNTIEGTPKYSDVVSVALNIFLNVGGQYCDYCFWDTGNSAINTLTQAGGAPGAPFTHTACNIAVTVNANGTVSFVPSS